MTKLTKSQVEIKEEMLDIFDVWAKENFFILKEEFKDSLEEGFKNGEEIENIVEDFKAYMISILEMFEWFQ